MASKFLHMNCLQMLKVSLLFFISKLSVKLLTPVFSVLLAGNTIRSKYKSDKYYLLYTLIQQEAEFDFLTKFIHKFSQPNH